MSSQIHRKGLFRASARVGRLIVSSCLAVGLAALASAPPASAQSESGASAADDGRLRVLADPVLVESGLLAHLAPRFRFKTRITLDIAALDAAAPPDAAAGLILVAAPAPDGFEALLLQGDQRFAASAPAGVDETEAARFLAWLRSGAGGRALAKFEPSSGGRFALAGAAPASSAAAAPAGEDVGDGPRLALQHCGRCHVVGEVNKYGGIGSTPSFPALRAIPSWREKFAAFWQKNPHPSFTYIEDVTEPFSAERPPHIAPVVMTLEEAEAIIAYAETIEPKDLGARIAPK
ncbi:MAG: hypothetical protein AAGM38_12435 [Pseudomonadota bacterium]